MKNQNPDQVILVDEYDREMGVMDKFEAHRNPARLHRAVSVWLINSQGELLFQQRSQEKIVGAGWWANTICGNVRPEESYDECAARRLKEELGIEGVSLIENYTFHYRAYGNDRYSEHEMDRVFIGKYDGEVKLNPTEVQNVRWFTYEELKSNSAWEKIRLKPRETLELSEKELEVQLPPLEIKIDNQFFLIAPWTALMWNDERLHGGRVRSINI